MGVNVVIEYFHVTITPFQLNRRISVLLPQNYHQSDKKYPVLYMHDGQNLFLDEEASFGVSWGIKEYLENKPDLELIVVGIDCNQEGFERFNEYAPWENKELGQRLFNDENLKGGKGKEYIDYITHELKPFIDEKYRTLPNETALAGSSMGGLISTYAACKYPEIYKKVASISSAYWINQKEIEEYVGQSDLFALERFYMDIGTKEDTSFINHQIYVDSSQAVYDILASKVENVRFEIVEDAVHNEAAWRERLPMIFGYLYE
ncbi:enterobactin/ferric enterobactin esterase [Bacillus sp. THAF10]|uniref:alpha/beta hydrolase n=1 Tax=Bacillus sp. THAF10 TaxID=2587848 RepID=UPI0012AA3677|nr:alpha/beta fold hydrolase [Bacillus sp. THAF10]QFT89538.1 enterobactin/ferric enterobactin esterase [Bacillus sp. THAF10]